MTGTERQAPVSGRAPWATPRDPAAVAVAVLTTVVALMLVVVAFVALLFLLPSDPLCSPGECAQDAGALETSQTTALRVLLGSFVAMVALVLGASWWTHRRRRRLVFSSPPGWPEMPPGWRPHRGWQPLPEWGPAPGGWTFWVERLR